MNKYPKFMHICVYCLPLKFILHLKYAYARVRKQVGQIQPKPTFCKL